MYCHKCGASNDDNAFRCVKCGVVIQPGAVAAPAPVAPRPAGDDPNLRMLIPVGRSGWAIAAGYAGLLGIIPVVGQLAILFAVLAVLDIRSHPEKHGMGRAVVGFVGGGFFTLLWLVILLRT